MTLTSSSLLIACSSLLFGTLGMLHLVYTFRTNAFHPTDPDLLTRLRQARLYLSYDLSLWSAWIGFNASHSLGIVAVSLIFGYLALFHHGLLMDSRLLIATNVIFFAAFLLLAKRYWSKTPLVGIALSLLLNVVGYALADS